MKIVIHLEEILIAPLAERACDPTSTVAHWILPARLRLGMRNLLRDLARTGNVLTLYSSGSQSPYLIRLWCFLVGLPIQNIVLSPPQSEQSLTLTGTAWSPESLHQIQQACINSHEIRIVSWGRTCT
jgi:hypothetical protein